MRYVYVVHALPGPLTIGGRPRPAGPPAPTGRSPDSVRAVRFRLRSAFAPSPRSRVQVPRPRGSWPHSRTPGYTWTPIRRTHAGSGSHAVQRRVSAAVRQGPTTPTRRPHASGQVINGSCALPARGAGASVPRTHMPTCASRDPLEPAVLRAVARQQVCANLRHRKRRHRGISYSRI